MLNETDLTRDIFPETGGFGLHFRGFARGSWDRGESNKSNPEELSLQISNSGRVTWQQCLCLWANNSSGFQRVICWIESYEISTLSSNNNPRSFPLSSTEYYQKPYLGKTRYYENSLNILKAIANRNLLLFTRGG